MSKNLHGQHTFRAIAVLMGTIIGAGILGIPYVVSRAGFITGLIDILLLGLAVLILNLFIGEIVLRTPGNHQFPGYAEKYLGKWGKRLFLFSMFFGIYGALIAYIIGEGESLAALFGGNSFTYSIIFFIVGATLLLLGLKTIIRSESIFVPGVALLILLISITAIASGKINLENLAEFNPKNLFMPYGVILFAFIGAVAIPEMKEYLTHDRKLLKKCIIIGSGIPILLFVLFALVTIGVTGTSTTEIATVGLGNYLGPTIIIFGNLLAVFAMFTSFLTLSLAMKEIYQYDYKINKKLAWMLTVFIPLIVFLLGLNSFIKVIAVTGALAGGLEGILFILMYWRARKKGERVPEYKLGKVRWISTIILIVFLLGIIYQLLSFNL